MGTGTHKDAPAKSIETEVKVELADLPRVRDRLVELGFRIRTPRAFEDNWIFDFPDRSLARRRQLLRVRSLRRPGLDHSKDPFSAFDPLQDTTGTGNGTRRCPGCQAAIEKSRFRAQFPLPEVSHRPRARQALRKETDGHLGRNSHRQLSRNRGICPRHSGVVGQPRLQTKRLHPGQLLAALPEAAFQVVRNLHDLPEARLARISHGVWAKG